MTSLLEYYRDPIFSILLLVCLVIIIALASSVAGSFKQRSLALRAKEFAAKFYAKSDLDGLSNELLAEFGTALLAQNRALRAKECFMLLANRQINCAYELALCNIRLGLFSQAMSNCELALAYIGRNEKALKALIYASFKQGDLSTASDAARALALCDEKQSAALKYLEGAIKPQAMLQGQIIYICPKCSHLTYNFEPFCANCFEFCEQKTYKRIEQ